MPTQGIERWLTQRLSGHLGARPGAHDGVCANVRFPFPGDADLGCPGTGLGNGSPGGSLVARTCGLAAHGGGGRALRRALAVTPGPAHPQLGDGGGVEALLEHPARGGSLRPLRRAPTRHAPALGRRGERRGGGRVAGPAVALVARADRDAEPGRAADRIVPAAAGRSWAPRPARPVSLCSGSRASPPATSMSSRPWPRGARCISSCCTPRRHSGTASPRTSARRRAS